MIQRLENKDEYSTWGGVLDEIVKNIVTVHIVATRDYFILLTQNNKINRHFIRVYLGR